MQLLEIIGKIIRAGIKIDTFVIPYFEKYKTFLYRTQAKAKVVNYCLSNKQPYKNFAYLKKF